MRYRVTVTNTAARERKRLDPQVRNRIDAALLALQKEPRPSGVRKLSGSQSDWRIRVGDYRILYEVDDDQLLVSVWRIAHRREAYR